MTAIGIVEDDSRVREAIAHACDLPPDMGCTLQAGSAEELFFRLTPETVPDVILMDIAMPEMGGIPATRAILAQYPQVRIIMLTSYPEDDLIQESLQAGAMGFLLKNSTIDTLANAIRSVHAGQPVLAPEVTKALIRIKTGPMKPGSDLSQREQEVLGLMVEGLSNEEIAERLVISPATARHHVSACIQKLGASNRAQASAMAVKLGLVS